MKRRMRRRRRSLFGIMNTKGDDWEEARGRGGREGRRGYHLGCKFDASCCRRGICASEGVLEEHDRHQLLRLYSESWAQHEYLSVSWKYYTQVRALPPNAVKVIRRCKYGGERGCCLKEVRRRMDQAISTITNDRRINQICGRVFWLGPIQAPRSEGEAEEAEDRSLAKDAARFGKHANPFGKQLLAMIYQKRASNQTLA